jgi:hypothetical protein
MARQGRRDTRVETFTHGQAKRWNIPTAELQSLVREDEAAPRKAFYPRRYNPDEHPEMYARNPDLDPQLVWRGKDEQDRHPLAVEPCRSTSRRRSTRRRSSTTCGGSLGTTSSRQSATCSPTSTACPIRRRNTSSTPTPPTGRTG